ncbi:mitochondrial matrix iron-sulfur protein [Glutinoglossum americanum]|uniref:Mitochondrial matrix iron-sulfur protein n=1 Tax=Glutinoglossum americanum TaxID=1670608 RepID=A0A9P8I8Q3_9PEZI|nr:mitochondrial matrix iron-sulfur protein [Glutinoglossum americanum]
MSIRPAASRLLQGSRRLCFVEGNAPWVSMRRRFASISVTSCRISGPPERPVHTAISVTSRRRSPQLRSCFSRARRRFSVSATTAHGHVEPPKPGEEIHVTFIDKEGDEHVIEVAKGDNLLDIAQANDLEVEGACGGSCACSTCHVIVTEPEFYDKMPEPDDDENDMLDLAFGLTETSRLGCQVKMTQELDGLKVKLPSMTRNLQASDFSKKSAGSAGG